MTAWVIILFALWTFPVISFYMVKLTEKKKHIRNRIILLCVFLNSVAAFGLLTNISATLKEIDWLIVTSIYFTICILLWLGFYQKKKIVKISALIIMVCIFAIGYISGTVGALGVGFVTAEYEPSVEKWLGDGFIYKETSLGNAVSDYRGKRVEIFRTIPWLPVIEWRVQNKVYQNYVAILTNPLTVEYKQSEKKIYLSASMWWENERKQEEWADTLSIGP